MPNCGYTQRILYELFAYKYGLISSKSKRFMLKLRRLSFGKWAKTSISGTKCPSPALILSNILKIQNKAAIFAPKYESET